MFWEEIEGNCECPVCHWKHKTPEAAQACADQAEKPHEVSIKTQFYMLGILFEVCELVGPAYVSHNPMILARVIEGDISFMFAEGEEVPETQVFDEGTVKKHVVK